MGESHNVSEESKLVGFLRTYGQKVTLQDILSVKDVRCRGVTYNPRVFGSLSIALFNSPKDGILASVFLHRNSGSEKVQI